MSLSDNIKRFRKLRGLSIQAMADKMGIDKAGIYKWEDGSTIPGGKKLTEISNALGVTVSELLEENLTQAEKVSDNTEKPPKGELPLDMLQKMVEGNYGDYLVIHKSVLMDQYRLVAIETYKSNEEQLAKKDNQIDTLFDIIKKMISGTPIELPKVEDTKKDLGV